MIKSVVATGVVSILWVTVGFSLAFGESMGGFIGNPSTFLFFQGVNSGARGVLLQVSRLHFSLYSSSCLQLLRQGW